MKPKVFVSLPCYGQMSTAQCQSSLLNLYAAFAQNGIGVGYGTLSTPDIVELRNVCLTVWYDNVVDSTHLLFIDHDMDFKPQMVLDMLAFDQPVVGCLYPIKKYPIEYVGKMLPNSADLYHPSGHMEVAGVGAGVLLIKRECIDEMLVRMVGLTDTVDHHTAKEILDKHGVKRLIRAFEKLTSPEGVLSEDLSFCKRWRDLGGKIWANVNHEIGHVGMHRFGGRYLDNFNIEKVDGHNEVV